MEAEVISFIVLGFSKEINTKGNILRRTVEEIRWRNAKAHLYVSFLLKCNGDRPQITTFWIILTASPNTSQCWIVNEIINITKLSNKFKICYYLSIQAAVCYISILSNKPFRRSDDSVFPEFHQVSMIIVEAWVLWY